VVENFDNVSGVYAAKRQLTDGKLIWGVTRKFDWNNYAYPHAIAVDGPGNVLVLIVLFEPGFDRRHLTILKSAAADGQIVWQRSLDSTSQYRRSFLTVDAQG